MTLAVLLVLVIEVARGMASKAFSMPSSIPDKSESPIAAFYCLFVGLVFGGAVIRPALFFCQLFHVGVVDLVAPVAIASVRPSACSVHALDSLESFSLAVDEIVGLVDGFEPTDCSIPAHVELLVVALMAVSFCLAYFFEDGCLGSISE
jgi:hypothetical protein